PDTQADDADFLLAAMILKLSHHLADRPIPVKVASGDVALARILTLQSMQSRAMVELDERRLAGFAHLHHAEEVPIAAAHAASAFTEGNEHEDETGSESKGAPRGRDDPDVRPGRHYRFRSR